MSLQCSSPKLSVLKAKVVQYLRDIFCLPQEYQDSVPRGTRRSNLASNEIGLFSKIEFSSDWSAERMKKEICAVFAKPFCLSAEDIEGGKCFPFNYLQRTGAGSRTLCVPAVAANFEWNG